MRFALRATTIEKWWLRGQYCLECAVPPSGKRQLPCPGKPLRSVPNLWLPLQPMTATTKAHIAVLAANLLFAVNFSMVKLVTPLHMSSYALNMARIGISVPLFWLLYLAKPSRAGIHKADIPRFTQCSRTSGITNAHRIHQKTSPKLRRLKGIFPHKQRRYPRCHEAIKGWVI
jgi:hypothetical protein